MVMTGHEWLGSWLSVRSRPARGLAASGELVGRGAFFAHQRLAGFLPGSHGGCSSCALYDGLKIGFVIVGFVVVVEVVMCSLIGWFDAVGAGCSRRSSLSRAAPPRPLHRSV